MRCYPKKSFVTGARYCGLHGSALQWPCKLQEMRLSAILAISKDGAIGHEGKLLWHLPEDLKRFQKLTTGKAVVMGRRTQESLPKGYLPHRDNYVVTSKAIYHPYVLGARNLEDALVQSHQEGNEHTFIIGGVQLYSENLHKCDDVYVTRVHQEFPEADTRLVLDLSGMIRISSEDASDGIHGVTYEHWVR